MTNEEFDNVTALEKVRQIKNILHDLDISLETLMIGAQEYGDCMTSVRHWEQLLQSRIEIRRKRSDAGKDRS